MVCMYVYEVWMHLRVYMSVQAMHGAGNALYWNDSERQNSMYLTLLKYPNTKTSLYKLSKNHWVIAFFKNFGSVRKKLQYTVLLDHPVSLDKSDRPFCKKSPGRPYETSCYIFVTVLSRITSPNLPKTLNHIQCRLLFVTGGNITQYK